MKTFLIASLIAACGAPQSPQNPQPAQNAPVATCTATGEQVFEIDHKKDAGDSVTSTAVLYTTGAWTYEDSAGIKHTGCLATADVAALRAKLAAATWTVEPETGARCMAMSADYSEYLALGKVVLTARTCSGIHLDPTSEQALEAAIALLTSVAKA